MRKFLARLLCGADLDELAADLDELRRWRTGRDILFGMMREFPDAKDALSTLKMMTENEKDFGIWMRMAEVKIVPHMEKRRALVKTGAPGLLRTGPAMPRKKPVMAEDQLARPGRDPLEPVHIIGEHTPEMLAAIRAAWDSPGGVAYFVDGESQPNTPRQ